MAFAIFVPMLTKIYFDHKTVVLAPEIGPALQAYQGPDVLWIDRADASSARRAIDALASPELLAAVLIGDPSTLLEGFKKELVVIQAAGGLVHTGKGEALLIFRRGKWDLPKGKLDPGEDLQTCALREISEETGLTHLEAEAPLCITYHTYHHKGAHVLKESHWYLVRGDKSDPLLPQTDEDIEQCLWTDMSKLDPYLSNAHASILDVLELGQQALAGRS